MGGSIGLALRKRGAGWRVVGWNRSAGVADAALAMGAIDSAASGPGEVAAEADVLVIALPPDRVVPMLAEVRQHLRQGAAVTDIAGAKARIVRDATALIGPAFVGGHPMTGSERSGIGVASADLYVDTTWVLTPTEATSPDALAAVESIVGAVGARPLTCGAEEHDRWIAAVSHLPHVLAYGLAQAAAEAGVPLNVGAGSFRDGTRVAAADPGAWTAILLDNAPDVVRSLDGFTLWAGAVRDAVACGDADRLQRLLTEARMAKSALTPGGATNG